MKRAVGVAAPAWAAAYGLVRVWFATGHAPAWKLPGDDLLVPYWISVVACLVSGGLVLAVRRWSRLTGALWAMAVGWVAAAGFVLLDLVAAVLPGLGIPFDPLGMVSRFGALLGAALLGWTARAHRLRPMRRAPLPNWIVTASACLAVAGCLIRLAAQAAVGFGSTLFRGGPSLIVFEGAFVLAGTALPILLAHPTGARAFPRWMLLIPGAVIGVGMTAYFGVGLLQMVVAVLGGDPVHGDLGLPDAFFWVAVPAYVVWGASLMIATYGCYLRTRQIARPTAGVAPG